MKDSIARFVPLDIVIVCGLPGSGKSHLSAQAFRASGRKRVNRKEIRKHLFEMMNFGAPWSESNFSDGDETLVKHVEHKLCEHLLFNRHRILIDNTSVTRASRKFYLDLAVKMRKSIGAIYIHSSVQRCLERNRSRPDPVPESVITNLYAAAEEPRGDEGFQEILVVKNE